MKHIIFMLALVGVVVTVTACSVPPYAHKAGEYNRAQPNFGAPVTDISNVTVCYNSYSATPQQVNLVAVDECAKYGKSPEFSFQKFNICPLAAPMAAVYSCVASTGGGGTATGNANQNETIRNYDGIIFRY